MHYFFKNESYFRYSGQCIALTLKIMNCIRGNKNIANGTVSCVTCCQSVFSPLNRLYFGVNFHNSNHFTGDVWYNLIIQIIFRVTQKSKFRFFFRESKVDCFSPLVHQMLAWAHLCISDCCAQNTHNTTHTHLCVIKNRSFNSC
jgi:hypothetical protein